MHRLVRSSQALACEISLKPYLIEMHDTKQTGYEISHVKC